MAAEQGIADAQHNLGWMYTRGQGGSQDFQEACKWFRKAAKQGNAAAQYTLGLMLSTGLARLKDENEVSLWFLKASEKPDAIIPAGRANIPIPNNAIKAPRIFPNGVIGYISP